MQRIKLCCLYYEEEGVVRGDKPFLANQLDGIMRCLPKERAKHDHIPFFCSFIIKDIKLQENGILMQS